jgi:peptide/nickel transport system substrate-binding protein
MASCQREPDIRHPGTFTISSGADAKRLLPPLAGDSTSGDISGLLHSGLIKYDRDLKLVGELAESFEASSDCRELTFHLRKGVKWHDGEEFTSDDVLFTYETYTDPDLPTPYGQIFGDVNSVEAVDDYTVHVKYNKPFAPAVESWGAGMMPRHHLGGKKIDDEQYTRQNIVGTGPYMFKKWVTGQLIELVANPDYFEGRPGIDRYIMRVIPDPATEFLELKTGGIDMMSLEPPQYKLKSDTEFFKQYFRKFRYPAFGFTYMGYNLRHKKFADVRVRRALGHAIDRQKIIKGVLLGYGSPATGPFPPESWAYNPKVNDPEYDPELATSLLAEAGWKPGPSGLMEKDGEPFTFTLVTNKENQKRGKTAQIIKEYLKAVGVEMDIQVLEWQTFISEFINKRRFEVALLGWRLSLDPDIYDIWHSSMTGEREFNFVSYNNPEVDRLLIEGRETCNMDRRRQIYHRIHEIIAQEQPYTFLYVADSLPVLHKRFKGVEQAPIGIMYDFVRWRVPANRAEWY